MFNLRQLSKNSTVSETLLLATRCTTGFMLIVLCFTGRVSAQVSNPYVFSISKDGRTSYVLGTIHSGVGMSELPAGVQAIIGNMKQFAGERAWSLQQIETELNPKRNYEVLLRGLREAEGGKELTAAQKRRLAEFGLPGEMIAAVSPGHQICEVVRKFRTRFASEPKLMDFEISRYALSRNLPLAEVEDQNIREAAAKSVGRTECQVREILSSSSPTPEVLREQETLVANAYRTGSLVPSNSRNEELIERNRRWIPNIEKLHAKAPTLFFVGTNHLIEPGNILELLKEQGFTVTEMNFSDRGSKTTSAATAK